MNITELHNALTEAERLQDVFASQTHRMAKMLKGNLRNISKHGGYFGHQTLRALKKELKQYNAITGEWRS